MSNSKAKGLMHGRECYLRTVNRILYNLDNTEWHDLSCQESAAGGCKTRESTLESTKIGERGDGVG